MTKEEKVKYWIDIADYDMETAEVMFNSGRWLYVGFMCHQVLEKTTTDMDKEYALNATRQYKEAIAPEFGNAKVYLYGSYAKGNQRAESDIDVAVVVPQLHDDWLEASSRLWKTVRKVNILIEPVLIEECHPSPLYDAVLQTGIAV